MVVAFTWNIEGYTFQQGVTVLKDAYQAAADALQEEWQRAKDEAVTYQDAVDSGQTLWIGERDEDGYVIWDQEMVHQMDIEAKIEGQNGLRKAFVLAAYHHWERGARTWTSDDVRDHKRLILAVKAKGIGISERLDAVRDLANVLKHDNDARGAELIASWPAVFPKSFQQSNTRTDWYDAVRLTDAHLCEVFDAIAASGPNQTTVYT